MRLNLNIKKPTTRNAKNTFAEIERSAIKLFYENGYHNTTIAAITKEAGVAAGTFYLYFPSKIVLYKHILGLFSYNIRKHIAQKVSEKTSRYEKEREGIRAFFNYLIENPEMYNVIWESLYIDRTLFKDYYQSFAERYKAGLDEAKVKGEIRDLDTEVLAYILMGISNFVGLKILFELGDNNLDLESMIDVIMQFLEKGLLTESSN